MLAFLSTRVSGDVIDLNDVFSELSDPRFGADVLFLGRVRDHHDGQGVMSVEYDAFFSLAEKTLETLAREAAADVADPVGILLWHRTGRLFPREISVAIRVAAPHRDDAYRVSRLLIEEIKRRVPVWKNEQYLSGRAEWLGGHPLQSV